MVKVLLAALNNRPDINVIFAKSLFEMYEYTRKIHDVKMMFFDYFNIEHMRNQATEYAIDNSFDYVFYMDADMFYPANSIEVLLSHNKEVIGGYYFSRKLPFQPVHFREILDELSTEWNYVVGEGLQKQEAGGFGGVLVSCEVLKKMKMPYFKAILKENGFFGEDIYFFVKLKELGIPAFVDTNLHFGHIINAAVLPRGQMMIV